jgi:hypothetical protein
MVGIIAESVWDGALELVQKITLTLERALITYTINNDTSHENHSG